MEGDAGGGRSARPPVLAVAGLTLRFGGVVVLDDVSFDVRAGEIFSIIGPNGAGKSSLFNCLSRLYQPEAGEMILHGVDLGSLDAHEVAVAGLARTFQNCALFPTMSVFENVVLGGHRHVRSGLWSALSRSIGGRSDEAAQRDRASDLLRFVGLDHLADRRVGELNFPSQKRIELARALMTSPAVLLLDEPSGGLTVAEAEEIAASITDIRDRLDVTVLLVEHRMPLVMAVSDRVCVLDSGRVIANGPPADVAGNAAVIDAYLGTEDTTSAPEFEQPRPPTVTAPAAANGTNAETVLECREVDASYGAVRALHGVSVFVSAGEVVGILGTNGAGKSTLMNVLAGTLATRQGVVLLHGRDVTARTAGERARRGLALVPEGRRLFADLTVEENLLAGGIAGGSRRSLAARVDDVYDLFPVLRGRRGQVAATLSGGQQQMVAVGRGLMSNPTVLLLDEPSLGLAPLIVRDVFDALRRLNEERGLSLLVVEQNPLFVTDYASRTYVLESGSIVGDVRESLSRDALRASYLGVGQ